MTLEVGQKAPDFTLPGDGGTEISLSDYMGKTLVLFFYPKDSTPGCTTESIGFSEALGDFEEAGATVIGMSKDTVKRHDNFITKNALKVRLASDEEGKVIESYGSWILKKLYGREYMGIDRSTFIICADGTVQNIWRKVKVKGHVDEVLKTVRALP
jgi:peroxiredoxin Q/BCP